MLKSVVLCVLVWHGMCEFANCAKHFLTDTYIPKLPEIVLPKINDTNVHIEQKVTYNFNITQQIFHVKYPSFGRSDFGRNFTTIDNIHRLDYLVTNGIGAHKLHHGLRTWSQARQICVGEGGDLAVIKSKSEEKIVEKMMIDASVIMAWLGFHDQFGQGSWTSALDEPLAENGWENWLPWAIKAKPNRGNRSDVQKCAYFWRSPPGMDSGECDLLIPFVCKITTI